LPNLSFNKRAAIIYIIGCADAHPIFFGDNIGVVHNTSIVPLARGTSEAEGVLLQESYHLPLFEGTPPNLGGEFQGG
jgi:hypothetical protein